MALSGSGWEVVGRKANGGVPQDSIPGPTVFLHCNNDLSDDVVCNTSSYVDDTNIYSKCDQAFDL